MQWAYQINVTVREPPLEDEDVQWLGPGMAVDLALLAVQECLCPGCHILGKTVPDIYRRNKLSVGKLPMVRKNVFSKFF